MHTVTPSQCTTLLPDSTLVEGELLALQEVAIDTTALAGTAGNDGVHTTGLKLLLERGLNLAASLHALGVLGLDTLAELLVLFLDLGALLLPSATDGGAVVGLVPRAERSGIDLDDGRAGEGVGADELVVGRVEGDGDDADLAGCLLYTSPSPRDGLLSRMPSSA